MEESELLELRKAAEHLWGLVDNQELILGTNKQALQLAKMRLEEAVGWATKGIVWSDR